MRILGLLLCNSIATASLGLDDSLLFAVNMEGTVLEPPDTMTDFGYSLVL
jgi:hypothetical protein